MTIKRYNKRQSRYWKSAIGLLIFIGLIGLFAFVVKTQAESHALGKVQAYQEMYEQARQEKEQLITENLLLKQSLGEKIAVEEKIKVAPEVKARALKAVAEKFGYLEVGAFERLINKESGFNLFALNKSSGACGMFQALPCSKLPGLDLESQLKWGLNYIEKRYGKPSTALEFHLAHNWY